VKIVCSWQSAHIFVILRVLCDLVAKIIIPTKARRQKEKSQSQSRSSICDRQSAIGNHNASLLIADQRLPIEEVYSSK